MLSWAVEQKDYPVAIRVPMTSLVSTGIEDRTNYSELNKFKVTKQGKEIAIIGAGNFFNLANEVSEELGGNVTVINPRFLSGLDTELLENLKQDHKLVITLEDGELDGGFGEKIARFYGNSDMKVLCYGAKKEFTDRVPMDELLTRYRLRKELIAEDAKKCIMEGSYVHS